MSYDISLEITDALGGTSEIFSANHTSNTAVMWREAGCDLAEFHDKAARELAPTLRAAVADLASRPGHYQQWNPENGWGSWQSTLGFLAEILDAADRWPDARVVVCR